MLSQPPSKLVSNNLAPKFLSGSKDAAVLVVTNAQVHEFHFEADEKIALVKGKPIKARFFLVQNPEDKNAPPVLSTVWHAASESSEKRAQELELIHQQAMAIRNYVEQKFGIQIQKHFINADSNENLLGLKVTDNGDGDRHVFNLEENAINLLSKTPEATVFERVAPRVFDHSEKEPSHVLIKPVFNDATLVKGITIKQRGPVADDKAPKDLVGRRRRKKAAEAKKAEEARTAEVKKTVVSKDAQPADNKEEKKKTADAPKRPLLEPMALLKELHEVKTVKHENDDEHGEYEDQDEQDEHGSHERKEPGVKAISEPVAREQPNLNDPMVKAQSYDATTNAQIEKHKKEIPNDSKPVVLEFEFKTYKIETNELSPSVVPKTQQKETELTYKLKQPVYPIKEKDKTEKTAGSSKQKEEHKAVAKPSVAATQNQSAEFKHSIELAELAAKSHVDAKIAELKQEVARGEQRARPGKDPKPYRVDDFGYHDTKGEDHQPTQPKIGRETNGIEFGVRGGTPTEGPKKLRKSDGLFLPQFEKDHKERRKRGVALTYKFIDIIYNKLGIPAEETINTTTYESTEAASKLMLHYLAEVLKKEREVLDKDANLSPQDIDDIIAAKLLGILLECGYEALGTEEYNHFCVMMTPEQKELVRLEMQKLFASPIGEDNLLRSKATAEYLKDVAKGEANPKDPFGKLIQLFFQNLGVSCDAGFEIINGERMQGPDKIDDINAATVIKSTMKPAQHAPSAPSFSSSSFLPYDGSLELKAAEKPAIVFKVLTESGKGEKAPRYEAKVRAGLVEEGYIQEWKTLLDNYIQERKYDKQYALKDRLTSYRDFHQREAIVEDLKKQMDDYAKVVAMEGPKGEIALRQGLLKKVQELKQGIHGVKLRRCLNQMEYQLLTHEAGINHVGQKTTELTGAFFARTHQEEYLANKHDALSFANNPFASCIKAIDKLYKHAAKHSGERREACDRVVSESSALLNDMLRKYHEKNRADQKLALNTKMDAEKKAAAQRTLDENYAKAFEEFKQQFVATLHSQDVLMNDRDKNRGKTMDTCLTVGTFGLFGALRAGKAAATKMFSNTTSSSLFESATTRVSLIGEIEKQFNKCVPAIAPRPTVEAQPAMRMTK